MSMKRISFIEAGAPGLHIFSKFAIDNGIDTIQFMMLTPLPGTPLYKEMKDSGRLLHTDWSKYDAHHAVFRPSLMSAQTLQTETLN